ncbi:MAG: DUF2780 domain-containing protein [Psychromonas sp.]|nr:DUF2780 domain-containing protein [Psychromonas sp.]
MKMKVLAAALLISTANVANAGWLDSLFASKEEAASPAATTTVPAVTTAVKSESSATIANAANIAAGLLPTLTRQLGVTDSQAAGGMGSLMQLAKGSLSSDEFSQLSAGVPNMSTLLAAVPASNSEGGAALSDMLSSAGGLASSIGGVAQLTQQFEALGLSSDMIAQFANIAISYFSQNGNTNTGELLQKGLSAILG